MSRKILLVGGTGNISGAVMRALIKDSNNEVVVINRGHHQLPNGVRQIICDVNKTEYMASALRDESFDCVIDFLVFNKNDAEARVDLFNGKTRSYFFISTVVAMNHENTIWLSENSAYGNRFSRYGQNKAAAEEVFKKAYLNGFPVCIVRPGNTYSNDRLPMSVKGNSCWSVISRILNDRSVIIHGDGKSVWHAMHADDFAYNFLQLLDNRECLGETINLVNPACFTWDMLYQEIGRQLNKKVRICHIASDTLSCSSKYNNLEVLLGDKQYSNLYGKFNISRFIPDFCCEITYQKGIEMYFQYMNEHPELKRDDVDYNDWCDSLIRKYHSFMKLVSEQY